MLGGWAHPALEAAFSYTTTTRSKHLSPGAIAGIVIGVLVALGAAAAGGWAWWPRAPETRVPLETQVPLEPQVPPETQVLLETQVPPETQALLVEVEGQRDPAELG